MISTSLFISYLDFSLLEVNTTTIILQVKSISSLFSSSSTILSHFWAYVLKSGLVADFTPIDCLVNDLCFFLMLTLFYSFMRDLTSSQVLHVTRNTLCSVTFATAHSLLWRSFLLKIVHHPLGSTICYRGPLSNLAQLIFPLLQSDWWLLLLIQEVRLWPNCLSTLISYTFSTKQSSMGWLISHDKGNI